MPREATRSEAWDLILRDAILAPALGRRNPSEPIVLVHYGPWHLFFALFLEMVISGYR